MTYRIKRLGAADLEQMKALLRLFGEVFAEPQTYQTKVPGDAYLRERLNDDTFFAVAAHDETGVTVGGLAAYELKKFEQERSEVYIYDLAVDATHRRRGVATALIDKLREIARSRGAWTIFVQADINEEDEPANALYRKLSSGMIVAHHYDIAP